MRELEQLANELDAAAFTCRAIIETPNGSPAKFAYDLESGLFHLGKLLPLGLAFPVDFGFIPSTLGGDNDPLDVLVLPEVHLPVGTLLEVRLLGIMEAEQRKASKRPKRNDRIIARLIDSRLYPGIDDLSQLGQAFVDELAIFFQTYKALKGQTYEILNVGGPDRAIAIIREGERRFQAQQAA